ncbi:MAG: helix-turn-helix transcriptional regulator [Clostridia bacterium]|nr:helix-turn-helix transcriptional regulator [Clostridia bacterium]
MITNRLQELRDNKGLTQKLVCKELKKYGVYIDRTTYSKYETGSHNIPCDILIKLADFYGTTCDYILGR